MCWFQTTRASGQAEEDAVLYLSIEIYSVVNIWSFNCTFQLFDGYLNTVWGLQGVRIKQSRTGGFNELDLNTLILLPKTKVIFEKRLDFWVSAFCVGSTSPYDGPLEEVKIKTVWSQDLGMFWSQDLELVELV